MKNSSLKNALSINKLPKHVAIIMDGNGRWAKNAGKERTFGHQSGLEAVRAALEVCEELNIPFLTLYAFSTENWNRPETEVNFLMKLLSDTLKKEIPTFQEKEIRLRAIGNIDALPKSVKEDVIQMQEETKNNQKGNLIIALNYGAKEEILHAIKNISKEILQHNLKPEDITDKIISDYLYTKDIPDVDLLIRTSGELRISNFLLWQIAYAELYFTDVLWPDFRHEDFYIALHNYQERERRFGKTSEQLITK